MHIVVTIKQVPETSNVKMDPETGTMIRSGSESIVNPLDLYALETALRIREETGGKITAITMGPLSAVKVLKEAIAMGCDDAVHLSDRAFGGADTLATSYTLAAAIRKLGRTDLIITGERATDGDTGQVGPGLSSWLGMALVTYAARLESVSETELVVERLLEEGYQKVKAKLPAVLTVVKEIAIPRLPTLTGKKRTLGMEIPVWGAKDLDVDPALLGLKGSPTRVVKIATPKVSRSCTVVKVSEDLPASEAVDRLMEFLESRNVLDRDLINREPTGKRG